MATVTAADPTLGRGRRTRLGPRLGARTRKSVLVVHIVAAGAWFGLDVVMAICVFTPMFSDDPRTGAVAYQALALFAVWPMFLAGLTCLLSGVVLGLGSKYGLLRYWWVGIKLVLNVVLSTLVLFALRPSVYEAAERGRQLAAGEALTATVTDLVFPPVVSSAALLAAVMLSVFKPWGRITGDRRPSRATARPRPGP